MWCFLGDGQEDSVQILRLGSRSVNLDGSNDNTGKGPTMITQAPGGPYQAQDQSRTQTVGKPNWFSWGPDNDGHSKQKHWMLFCVKAFRRAIVTIIYTNYINPAYILTDEG